MDDKWLLPALSSKLAYFFVIACEFFSAVTIKAIFSFIPSELFAYTFIFEGYKTVNAKSLLEISDLFIWPDKNSLMEDKV